jgi:hypothetical protein
MNFFREWGEIAWIILAMMGGIARYLDSYLKEGKAPKLGMLLAHGMVSGFSGYMVAQVALAVGRDDWALIAAGIGGYLGTQGLDFVADQAKKRLGDDNNSNNESSK